MFNHLPLIHAWALPAVAKPLPINSGSLLFFGLLIIAIGMTSIIHPQFFWHLRVGRKIPGVPPNKLYLSILRTGGLLVVALGLALIYNARMLNN